MVREQRRLSRDPVGVRGGIHQATGGRIVAVDPRQNRFQIAQRHSPARFLAGGKTMQAKIVGSRRSVTRPGRTTVDQQRLDRLRKGLDRTRRQLANQRLQLRGIRGRRADGHRRHHRLCLPAGDGQAVGRCRSPAVGRVQRHRGGQLLPSSLVQLVVQAPIGQPQVLRGRPKANRVLFQPQTFFQRTADMLDLLERYANLSVRQRHQIVIPVQADLAAQYLTVGQQQQPVIRSRGCGGQG